MSPVDAALSYVAHCWPIFPVHPANKHPLTRHGFKDATTEIRVVIGWWRRWPKAMMATPCGKTTGIFVVDLDRDRDKNLDGITAIGAHGRLPATVMATTPRGGRHVYFMWKPGITNRRGELPVGCDIRGEGGSIILPPSRRSDGAGYRWLIAPSTGRFAEPPAWLLALIEPPVIERASPVTTPLHGTNYAQAAVAGECRAVETAPAGARNHTLNRAAFCLGQLIAANMLNEGEVIARLINAALKAGLTRGEALPTIKSGIAGGHRKPRRAAA